VTWRASANGERHTLPWLAAFIPGESRSTHSSCSRGLSAPYVPPPDPSDGLVEIEADDKHDFKERLAEIKVPTLVIGGEEDFFYPIRETAAGIPNAKLVLYKGVGHGAMIKRQFSEDVVAFLTAETKATVVNRKSTSSS